MTSTGTLYAALCAVVVVLAAGNPINEIFFEGSGLDPRGFSRQKSAFTAKLTTDLDSSWYETKRIVFDSVLNTVGDDYNPYNGKFTTTISGTYVFSVTLMSKYSSGKIAFGCLRKNGLEQVCVWSNGNSANEMSSNTITLNLKEGDVVDVALKAGSYGLHNYDKAGYCSFTGFLLYPEESILEQLLKVVTALD